MNRQLKFDSQVDKLFDNAPEGEIKCGKMFLRKSF